jgi:hypothetical protein
MDRHEAPLDDAGLDRLADDCNFKALVTRSEIVRATGKGTGALMLLAVAYQIPFEGTGSSYIFERRNAARLVALVHSLSRELAARAPHMQHANRGRPRKTPAAAD